MSVEVLAGLLESETERRLRILINNLIPDVEESQVRKLLDCLREEGVTGRLNNPISLVLDEEDIKFLIDIETNYSNKTNALETLVEKVLKESFDAIDEDKLLSVVGEGN